MDEETKQALEESITHWIGMRNYSIEDIENQNWEYGRPYADDCTLCQRYVMETESCTGCPVEVHTEKPMCDGSPYIYARDAFIAFKDSPCKEKQSEWQEAADKEIEFLKSLRPASSKKSKPQLTGIRNRLDLRVWDASERKMHYLSTGDIKISCAGVFTNYDEYYHDWPIMLATGKEDCEGRQIYHGDRVQFKDIEIGVVTFDDGCYWLMNEPLFEYDCNDLNITGHVYE